MSLTTDPSADVSAITQIDAVPTILDVVCHTTGMGFAAVITEDRWIACAVRDDMQFGLQPGGELKLSTTICNEIRDGRRPIIIDHVAEDPLFRMHRTPAIYGFQSYISVPIILPDGAFFGTLCAIDPKPTHLSRPETIGMFRLFADLIAFHLDAHRRLATSEANLTAERENAELREKFIAVLGHDLRNPLASVEAGARMLLRTPLNDEAQEIVSLIEGSVRRMAGLIDNVLDFARGHLGNELALESDGGKPLAPVLEQIVAELRAAKPDRIIETEFRVTEPVPCDRARIGQLLSNLVANALTHGKPDGPVRIQASTTAGRFEMSVSNAGDPIPEGMMEKLFHPFFRASARPGQQGLGLGLYIASDIARAHGGTLDVISSPQETRFSFRMPLG